MDRSHLEFLRVYAWDKKIRLGINTDGGYVIAELDGGYDCYVSAGVGREESFTRDFLARYSFDEFNSYAIDGSIDEYPSEYTNNISFIKKNISGINDDSTTNLASLTDRYNNIFLKIDVEGGEYPWIQSMSHAQLSKFKQIVIEYHGSHNNSWGTPYSVKKACYAKMAETHYLVHAHGSNSRSATMYLPNTLEMTYIRKDAVEGELPLNTTPLPIDGLDYPNNTNRPDHTMNIYPFVLK
jgi:hypothetical protein